MMHFVLAAVALVATAALRATAQDDATRATCLAVYDWMDNDDGWDACKLASEVGALCNSNFYVPPLRSNDTVYFFSTPSECACTLLMYQALSACETCQGGRRLVSWETYTDNCTTAYHDGENGGLQLELPDSISLPLWSMSDTTTDGTWNATLAQNAVEQSDEESSGDGGSGAGAIAGGVIAAVVAIALIAGGAWYYMRRRQRRSADVSYSAVDHEKTEPSAPSESAEKSQTLQPTPAPAPMPLMPHEQQEHAQQMPSSYPPNGQWQQPQPGPYAGAAPYSSWPTEQDGSHPASSSWQDVHAAGYPQELAYAPPSTPSVRPPESYSATPAPPPAAPRQQPTSLYYGHGTGAGTPDHPSQGAYRGHAEVVDADD